MPAPEYAELHCLSNFTFLRGASHPDELVTQAAALGYAAIGITDECSLAGVVRAHVAAKEAGIKLIIGSEIRLADGPKLVVLAVDRDGYGNLSELITRGRRNAAKGSYHLDCSDLAHGLPGCLILWIPERTQAPASRDISQDQAALSTDCLNTQHAQWLTTTFPQRGWILLELHHDAQDDAWQRYLHLLAERHALPLSAAGDVHMHRRHRRALQDVLTAIRLGTTVGEAANALFANGERHLRSRERLANLYPRDCLAETMRIEQRCRFSLDELRYEYPDDLVPEAQTPSTYLRHLTEQRMHQRWPTAVPESVRKQIKHELEIIAELHYEHYFLTVYDIVRFARSRGILCQGRGSAANSAVCYCLGITSVDPSCSEMLFERFVSKDRNEPPDIDVDFEHERREEVIQYIYAKYGREQAALAATVITYRRKSALRDVGKVLGLEREQIDRLSGAFAWWDQGLAPERIREAGFDPDSPNMTRLLYLVEELRGFPRHLSQHVGGFVIARDRVSRLVPIENAAMAKRTVIQWDKDDLDAMGILKVDCLGLGMLSAIHKAFDLVRGHRGRQLTLANVPVEDPKVYAMICKADTIGVFQIESRAQMSMLPRLRPQTFYDLVVEVSIVRPGPIQGNMVHPYLKRRQGLEPISYPSDAVRGVLERTLGVPIFQEQVIKLAMVAAGFSAGEADQLRRAIGSWRRRAKLEYFRQRLIDGMRERGYAEAFAQQIYDQIQGFGEYGFPESHAASFALLVYVSSWLKHYEPAAFTCALLNSQPMGFYAPSQLIQDAQRHGIEIRPVDVALSTWDCTLEDKGSMCRQPALRLGLRLIKGLGHAAAQCLVETRQTRSFDDVDDLVRRTHLSRKDLEALAAAGALSSLAGHRHRARWHVLGAEAPMPLFSDTAIREPEPQLSIPTEGQDLVADYASLGLTLGRHPLTLLRTHLRRRQLHSAEFIQTIAHGAQVRLAGLVITRQRPASAAGVTFLTLEDETGIVNVIVWQDLADRQRKELLHARLLAVNGQVQREGEVLHVVARRLEDHSALLGELLTRSRDFH